MLFLRAATVGPGRPGSPGQGLPCARNGPSTGCCFPWARAAVGGGRDQVDTAHPASLPPAPSAACSATSCPGFQPAEKPVPFLGDIKADSLAQSATFSCPVCGPRKLAAAADTWEGVPGRAWGAQTAPRGGSRQASGTWVPPLPVPDGGTQGQGGCHALSVSWKSLGGGKRVTRSRRDWLRSASFTGWISGTDWPDPRNRCRKFPGGANAAAPPATPAEKPGHLPDAATRPPVPARLPLPRPHGMVPNSPRDPRETPQSA